MASTHWETRLQQRGIPLAAIDLLLEYGESVHDHHGAEILYLPSRAKKRIVKEVSPDRVPRLDKLLDVYVVLKGSGIATVGHRHKKLNRS